jgi:hypothetical protein
MWVIVLEAAGALAVLLFIVWWTMFSGRSGGELPGELPDEPAAVPDASPGAAPAQSAVDEASRGGSTKLKG